MRAGAAAAATGTAGTTTAQQAQPTSAQTVPTQVRVHPTVPSQPTQVTPTQPQLQPQNPPQITLEEVRVILRTEEEEEEEEFYEEEEEESEDGEDERPSPVLDVDPTRPHSVPHSYSNAHLPAHNDAVTPRKRSCGDLDTDVRSHGDGSEDRGTLRVATPPKRARTTVEDVATTTITTNNLAATSTIDPNATPMKQRKRSSEELDTHLLAPTAHDQRGLQKRLRVEGTGTGVSFPVAVPLSPSRCTRGGTPRLGIHNSHAQTPRSRVHAHARMPRSLSTTPPSSITASAPSEDGLNVQKGVSVEDIGEGEMGKPQHSPHAQARTHGLVDVSMCTIGDGDLPGLGVHRVTGLVEGGELDGLYVFEEGV